jgi:hypothetical protein
MRELTWLEDTVDFVAVTSTQNFSSKTKRIVTWLLVAI